MILTGELQEHHVAALLNLDAGVPLILCSTGGDISVCRAMCDVLRALPRPVIGLGEVCSAAIPILACGKPRLAAPYTCFIWHEPYATIKGASWSAHDAEIERQGLVDWTAWANGLLAELTVAPTTTWEKLGRGAGTYFLTDKALELGLVDSLVFDEPVKGTKSVFDSLQPRAKAPRRRNRHKGNGK